MSEESGLKDQNLKTPRAAAIAGILFSVLFTTSHLLIRSSIPADPLGSAVDIVNQSKAISVALDLAPFAGIAFLWFVGVVRDRLGKLEDRFFATVFLGSGLLFVAMFFVSAALAGGLLLVLSNGTEDLIRSGAYALGRAEIYQITNVYATKMAGVFMISVSTVFLRTRIVPRWISFLGYGLAVWLLLSARDWSPIVFPLWVFLISVCFLIENFRDKSDVGQILNNNPSLVGPVFHSLATESPRGSLTLKAAPLLVWTLAGSIALNAGSTKIISSWFAPDAKDMKFTKLLVVAITAMPVTRRETEDEMVSRIKKRGNQAQASYELLSEAELEDLSTVKTRVIASGADGAVLLRLHTFNRATKHAPGQAAGTGVVAGGRVDPTFQEYTFFAPHSSSDDLTYTKVVAEIETMLYSVKADKLVWRGVSRTKNPLGPRKVAGEIADVVVQKMKQQRLIAK